ncbi:MAG: hypothetical protein ACKOSS_09880 [Planctomycetia bacterium]
MKPGLLRLGSCQAPQDRAVAEAVAARLAVAHALVALSCAPGRVAAEVLAAALGEGRIDAALLPLAALPIALPARTALGCVLPRAAAHAVLVGAPPGGLAALPAGARVLCAQALERDQLAARAPQLCVEQAVGGAVACLASWRAAEAAAVVLAADDLQRLGEEGLPGLALGLDEVLPEPCAGAWGLLLRSDDAASEAHVAPLRDVRAAAAVTAERAARAALERQGAAAWPGALAAHATCSAGSVRIVARWVAPGGAHGAARVWEALAQASLAAAAAAGEEVAGQLAAQRAAPGAAPGWRPGAGATPPQRPPPPTPM